MLGTSTLLTLGGGGRRVRLSYVFQDDSGCRKGLTVRRLLPDPLPSSGRGVLSISQRPGVHVAGGARAGILDPEPWEGEPLDLDDFRDQGPISVGVLTCVFTISYGVEISSAFRPAAACRIVDLPDSAGQAAHLDGKRIGTILDQLNHLQLKDQYAYPLLCLERPNSDLVDPAHPVRNGAMVATEKGALIGVIVSIFDGDRCYAVAPIRELLEWHRLHFLQDDAGEPEQPLEPAVQLKRTWELRPQTGPKVRELIGA